MWFLRPLAPPRPSFARSVLRSLSTQTTTAPTTQYTPPQASPNVPPHESDPSSQLTYHVDRTPAKQLPVYHINKRQGNMKQTRIRRITGSIADLKRDLQKGLKLEDGHIRINSLTQHIIIKGWKKHDVARFLRERLF